MENKRFVTAPSPNSAQNPQRGVVSTDLDSGSGDYGLPVNQSYSANPMQVHVQGEDLVEPVVRTTAQDKLFGARNSSHRKSVIVSACVTFLVILITASSMLFFTRKAANRIDTPKSQVNTQDIALNGATLEELPQELTDGKKSLLVNGDLTVKGDVKISNGNFVTVIKIQNPSANQTFTLPGGTSGTICLDSNNCGYVTPGQLQQLQDQVGQIVTPGIPASSLVNGQAGAVTIQGLANRISVATNNGVIQLSTPQDLAAISSPTFANLLLTGTLTTPLNCTSFGNGGVLTTNGSGQVICDNDDGGAGSPVNGSGSVNRLALFSAAQTIADLLP